ncbi:hypothetical protein CDD83_8685 [Cordyceps sp. RAO-2017]|nr:hypothetical protein CDD83_8685 [Cordyceps sp. RAO-2017]
MAIPQIRPDPAAAFVSAYPAALLRYGVTEPSWRSFLDTVSGFLAATVSDRAISHASDMARHIGQGPRLFGRGVVTHARSVGRDIADNARRGNVVGTAVGILEGAVSLPVATALGAAGSILQLPSSALDAMAKRPQTPRQRAAAYAAVANRDWLNPRGLHAQLLDSAALARVLAVSLEALLGLAHGAKGDSASAQLGALETFLSPLQVGQDVLLTLSATSLWMVLMPVAPSQLRTGLAGRHGRHAT